jgi:hypothetical protein
LRLLIPQFFRRDFDHSWEFITSALIQRHSLFCKKTTLGFILIKTNPKNEIYTE